ncbi:MAG: hypothetical protein ACM3NH_00210, partial [Candidatus Saccharibacteria bacterium]
MVNKTVYTRDMVIEARVLASQRNNQEAVDRLGALLARMKRRKSVAREFLTVEEKDLLDWA